MASEQEIRSALKAAAEALASRKLTEAEADRLLRSYNTQTGTTGQKARNALRDFFYESEAQFGGREVRASDDLDRLDDDLRNVLDGWRKK